MMQMSFAWTTLALLSGVKQVTRRDWSPRTVRLFQRALAECEPVAAFDRQARFGGKQVATIELVSVQEGEQPSAIPALDWELEGFGLLQALGLPLQKGYDASDVWRYWLTESPDPQTVVRFRLDQLTAPLDRKAIQGWVDTYGLSRDVIDSLPSLQDGEAWFWSPAWLRCMERVQVRRRTTFDSGATPAHGERVQPTQIAQIDLSAIAAEIAATVERAKADDPTELRKEIAALKHSLASAQVAPIPTPVDPQAIEAAVLDATTPLLRRLDALESQLADAAKEAYELASATHLLYVRLANTDTTVTLSPAKPASPNQTPRPDAPRPTVEPLLRPSNPEPTALKPKQQQIIDAIHWWESMGISPSGLQVGAVALIDASGGYFSNMFGPLVTAGFAVRGGGVFALTEAGRALASPLPDTPTMAAYHDMLRQRLKGMKSSNGRTIDILNALIDAGEGVWLTVQALGEIVGIDTSGGYFSNSIGPLSTMRLIERRSGSVRSTPLVFPKGLK